MKAEFRFYMPSRLLAHFSKSTNVWVCNYTLNAVFFFFRGSTCRRTNIKPHWKCAHSTRQWLDLADAPRRHGDNSAENNQWFLSPAPSSPMWLQVVNSDFLFLREFLFKSYLVTPRVTISGGKWLNTFSQVIYCSALLRNWDVTKEFPFYALYTFYTTPFISPCC